MGPNGCIKEVMTQVSFFPLIWPSGRFFMSHKAQAVSTSSTIPSIILLPFWAGDISFQFLCRKKKDFGAFSPPGDTLSSPTSVASVFVLIFFCLLFYLLLLPLGLAHTSRATVGLNEGRVTDIADVACARHGRFQTIRYSH